MRKCCGSGQLKIVGGRFIDVPGDGSAQTPFVVDSRVALGGEDTKTFDIGVGGTGDLDSPWIIRVGYASTAQLTDLPDVLAPAPGDWQVLAWSPVEQKWVPAPPSVTMPGQVLTDSSLTGDGSVGDELGVIADTARYLQVTASGVGLNDAGVNALVRVFPDVATRNAASPAPLTNTISLLASSPGQIDFWDGAQWRPITNGIGLDVQPGELLALSGGYAGGQVTQYVAQLDTDSDSDGLFEVIPAADLSTYAGVLTVDVAVTGAVAWQPTYDTDSDRIVATAYRMDDGTPYASAPLTGVVTALLY